jgi:hypothetical protein
VLVIEDGLEDPELPMAHHPTEGFLGPEEGGGNPTQDDRSVLPVGARSSAEADARRGALDSASAGSVVAKQRCSFVGRPRRLIVKVSSRPSNRLAASHVRQVPQMGCRASPGRSSRGERWPRARGYGVAGLMGEPV